MEGYIDYSIFIGKSMNLLIDIHPGKKYIKKIEKISFAKMKEKKEGRRRSKLLN